MSIIVLPRKLSLLELKKLLDKFFFVRNNIFDVEIPRQIVEKLKL